MTSKGINWFHKIDLDLSSVFGEITHQSNVSKIRRNYIPENGDLRISLFLSGYLICPIDA